MIDILLPLTGLFFPVLLLVGGGGIGRLVEHHHTRTLTVREGFVLPEVMVTNLREPPAGTTVLDSSLVVGEVVIASDYAKQLMASLRGLVGGEVRSFQRMLDRGRREALLRAVEQARLRDADLLLNVRFATTRVTNMAAEVVCYATAVRTG